jgi:nicotinate dehydrogenase subunit B
LHSDSPNNLLRAVLEGVNVPGLGALGAMPAFGNALDDRQIADLAAYLRARFAADKAPWTNLPVESARLRD